MSRLAITRILLFPALLLALTSHHAHPEGSIWDRLLPICGLMLLVIAMGGRIWAGTYVAGRKNQVLVTEGPYSVVRNPLYLFSLVGFVGAGLALESLTLAGLFGIIFLVGHLPAILEEERRLEGLFGMEYLRYRERVPRFVPSLRGLRLGSTLTLDLRAALGTSKRDLPARIRDVLCCMGNRLWRRYTFFERSGIMRGGGGGPPTGTGIVGAMVGCWLLGILLAPGQVAAEQITSVTIDSIGPYEGTAGYTYLEATMNGRITREDGSEGEYSVPVILKYPADDGNGVGVVDWVNSSRLQNFDWLEDEFLIGQLLLITAGDYLFEEGYTYAAVQWGKSITEIFGPTPPDDGRRYNHLAYGTIERGPDAFQILRDVAHFLRDPSPLESDRAPSPVDAVLSAGYSQTGALQMAFLSQGQNVSDGELVYDGHLIAKIGRICPQLDDVPPDFGMIPVPCTENPTGDGSRVIHVAAQGDLESMFMAALVRFEEDPNWRQYELAGTAHIPPSILEIGGSQNPIESAPAIRGALRSLSVWVTEGTPAPPSRFIAGSIDDEGNLQTTLDADGNAVGGLRLPHMEQVIDGHPAGAPLGTYAGLDPAGEPPFGMFGGAFVPFSDEELRQRYLDHEAYVERVTRAADRLLEEGYIVEADRDAYVREAARSSIGRSPPR